MSIRARPYSSDEMVIDISRDRSTTRTSWLVEHKMSVVDAAAAVIGLLLCVAYGSVFLIPGWTPRVAVLLVSLPMGGVILALQMARRDAIAIVCGALVATSVVTGVLSGQARSAILGTMGTEASTLILAGSLGLLAIGRELSEQGRRAVGWAVVAGASLSSAVGLLQYVAQADSGLFSLYAERPSGLTSNPVYFGAVAAGAFGIVVGRRSTNPRTVAPDAFLAGWFGIAIALSGSRVALGSAVVIGSFVLLVRRNRRALTSVLGVLVGVAIGTVITSTVGSGLSAVNRVSSSSAGDRRATWSYALDAFRERPLHGWGLGQFRSVVQNRITVELARTLGAGRDRTLFDAHNIVIGVAVSLGLVGIVGLLSLAFLLIRRARGGLAVGACGLALSWLLQPMGLATFPLAMLLFGASLPVVLGRHAVPEPDVGATDGSIRTFGAGAWLVWLLIPGLVAGLYLVVVENSIQRAADRRDAAQVEEMVRLLPNDPFLADIAAQAWQLYASPSDPQATARSLEWSERAVSLQAQSSMWWIRHAIREFSFGYPELALRSVREARRLEPNSWLGVDLELILLQELGDEAGRAALMPLGCELGVPSCTRG